MSHRESMEEDDMVIRVGSSLEGRDEPIRRARRAVSRGAYKEVPRASRRLALAATKPSGNAAE